MTLNSAAVSVAGAHTARLRFSSDTPYTPLDLPIALMVRAADLRVAVTAPSSALAGAVIPVTLSYANDGTITATAAVLTATLPVSLVASGPLTWTLGDLPPFAAGSRAFTATLAAEMPSGVSFPIWANLTSDNREFISTNNTSHTLVFVAELPQAAFTSSAPTISGQATVFTNATTGSSPLTYRWDFGDQKTSPLASPAHIYQTPGLYTVTLTATNNWGQSIASLPVTITESPPVAGFITSAPHPLGWITYFTNTTFGADVSYLWDFGDDTPLVAATDTTHTYAAAGAYTVTLTATNSGGTDVFTDVINIGPADCIPVHGVAFTFAPISPTMETLSLGVMVTFTGTAAGGSPPITFDWDFGDTLTGSGAVVTHTYVITGELTVTMTAENPCGRIVLIDTLVIVAPEPPPPPEYVVYLPLVMRQ